MSRATTATFQGTTQIGSQHIGDTYVNFMSDVQSQKVPYHIVEINQDLNSTFEEVAALLNLQINIQIKNTKYGVPFIEPINFQELRNIDKLLLKGLRGVGKSRCAFELLKEYLNTNRDVTRKILIINPILAKPDELTINQLKDEISNNDLILWPDFPRGLPFKDNPVYGLQTLGLLMTLAHRIHLTLDHEYLKSYDKLLNSIIEPKIRNVIFDENAFTKIIESYGNIHLFQEIFSRFIINRIDEVSKILFEKEPTPALVEVFFREALVKKSSGILNPLLIARNIKTGIDYYKDSFRFIVNNNPNEAHFLYILKLCYDLGLPRTRRYLKDLQTAIFGNTSIFPDSPPVNLDTLVISTKDGEFSMHDNLKNAISYPEEWSREILQYFFSKDYLDKTNENFSQQILFGTFLGRNIHLISSRDTILPDHVRLFMAAHPGFLSGFSAGLGSIFETIDDVHKRKIWKMVEDNNFLQFSLFSSFGLRYSSLDRDTKQKIWKMVEHDIECRFGIGMSIGSLFPSLDKETRDKIWKMVDDDIEFGWRVLTAMSSIIPSLDKDTRDRIWTIVGSESIFSFNIGLSLGTNFPFFDDNTKQHILANLHKNDTYCMGFYEGIGMNYMKLDVEFQNQLISNNPPNERFESYEVLFGVGLGVNFLVSDYDDQIKILDLVDEHENIRIGLAGPIGFKFESYEEDIKQRILSISLQDDEFANSLFTSFGMSFHTLKPTTQDEVLSRIKSNEDLARSFGSFLGRNLLFVDYNLDKIIKWIDDYKGLADEFGLGISSIYATLRDTNKKRIWELVEKNDNFKSSLLYGFGLNLISVLNFKEILKEIVAKIETYQDDVQDFFDGLFEALSNLNLNQNMIDKLTDLLQANPNFSALFSADFISFLGEFSNVLFLDKLPPEKYEKYNILLQDERLQDILCNSLTNYLYDMDDSFLGNLSLLLNNYKNIEDKFNKYVNQIPIDRNNIENLIGKGFFLYSQQKYEDAVGTFDQALSIKPSTDLYILKGTCLSLLNKSEDAVNTFNEALNLDSKNTEALDALGQIYNDVIFDYPKAYEIGKKLKELRGSNNDKFAVIESLIEIKEFDKAINQANEILSSSTSSMEKGLANLFTACSCYLQLEPLKGLNYITESLNFLTEKTGSMGKDDQLTWNFDGLINFLNHTDINSEEKKLIFNLFSLFKIDRKHKVESNYIAPSN